jgi:tetratricopeptide (TPR) repeat protein
VTSPVPSAAARIRAAVVSLLRRAAPALAICALGALAYANALRGAFQFDDAHAVVDNPWIRSFRHLPAWFTDARTFSVLPQNQDWRPLVLLAHAVSYAAGGGLSPVAFHLLNLAVHLACAVLVYRIAVRLLARGGGPQAEAAALWPALLAGALFAVHPLQSETVDYVSSRSESLAALGILAGFAAHLRGRSGRAMAWMAVGLCAKATAFVLPALCWLDEVVLGGEPAVPRDRRRWLRYAGWAAVALAFLTIRHFLVSDFSVQSRATTPRLVYLMTEARAFWHYVGLFLVPVGQCADADFPLTTSALDPTFLRAAAALAGLAAVAWGVRRRAPLVTFGIAWFAVALAPTSTILPLAEPTNEHRPYAAIAGLCWAAAWLASRSLLARGGALRGRVLRAAPVLLVLGALVGATWQRNRVWRDELSLWTDVVEKAPGNGRAHLNLGLALAARGRFPEALGQYRRCQEAWPAYAYCPLDRAVLLGSLGQQGEALASFAQAERLDPKLFWVPYHRGVLLRRSDGAASVRDLERAAALSPGFPAAHRELAASLAVLGDRDRARTEVDRAIALDPQDGEAFALRGYLEQLAGAREPARADARTAVALSPRLVQPRVNLGWLAEEDGDLAQAGAWYRSAAALAPGDADLRQRLARVEAAQAAAPGARP